VFDDEYGEVVGERLPTGVVVECGEKGSDESAGAGRRRAACDRFDSLVAKGTTGGVDRLDEAVGVEQQHAAGWERELGVGRLDREPGAEGQRRQRDFADVTGWRTTNAGG